MIALLSLAVAVAPPDARPHLLGVNQQVSNALFLDCTLNDTTPATVVRSSRPSNFVSKLFIYAPDAHSIDAIAVKIVDRSGLLKGYQVVSGRIPDDGKNQPLIRFHSLFPVGNVALILLGQRAFGQVAYRAYLVSGSFDAAGKLGDVDVRSKPSFGGSCIGVWGEVAQTQFDLAVSK